MRINHLKYLLVFVFFFFLPVLALADTRQKGQSCDSVSNFCDGSQNLICDTATKICITDPGIAGSLAEGQACNITNDRCDTNQGLMCSRKTYKCIKNSSASCADLGLVGQICCLTDSADPVCVSFKNGSQPGVAGSSCSTPGLQDTCGEGLICNQNLKCAVPGVPDTRVPSDASTKIPGPNPAWCNNDPNLEYSNGVCLPKSDFFAKSGIAGSSSLSELMLKIIQLLLTFAGIIGVLILVVGGFWYLTSAGNDEQAEKGKKAIMNAIIGLVVVILAYAIVTVISSTLITDKFINK